MINNQNTKNTLAGAAGVIAGELIYNAVMPDSVNASESVDMKETNTQPEVKPETISEETTKTSIHDLNYDIPDDSTLEAENGLKTFVADLSSEQMETDPLTDMAADNQQDIQITELPPVESSLDGEQFADAGITDTDLGIMDGNFA